MDSAYKGHFRINDKICLKIILFMSWILIVSTWLRVAQQIKFVPGTSSEIKPSVSHREQVLHEQLGQLHNDKPVGHFT